MHLRGHEVLALLALDLKEAPVLGNLESVTALCHIS